MNTKLTPEMVLSMIEDTRQLSFRVSEHAAYLIAQQEKIAQMSNGLNEILSLRTTVEEKSLQLDAKIDQMKSLT